MKARSKTASVVGDNSWRQGRPKAGHIHRAGIALCLAILLVAGVARGQNRPAAPAPGRTVHFPMSRPEATTPRKATASGRNGTFFPKAAKTAKTAKVAKSAVGANEVIFPAEFTAIGPAPIRGNNSGRITALAADPTNNNVIYIAAAGGGVWKTTDGGNRWTAMTDQLPDIAMGAIAIDPTNTSVIYAGSGEASFSGDSRYGEGVYKSTDGGGTWTVYTGPGDAFVGLSISKIVVDPVTPTNVYLTTAYSGENGTSSSYGVYKSTDAGVTWASVTPVPGEYAYTDLAIDPSNPQTLYAAGGYIYGDTANGIYKTTDGGTSWTLLTGFPNGTQAGNHVGRISLAISPSNPQVLYADYSSSDNATFGSLGGFFATVDGGNTWTQSPASTDGTGATGVPNFLETQGWYDNVLVVSPTNPSEVFAAGVVNYAGTQEGQYNAIIASFNGGQTFSDFTTGPNGGPHTDHHALGFTGDGSQLLDGNDGGIWRCENPNVVPGGNTVLWTDLNTNLNMTQFTGVALHPTDPTIAYGGSQDNGTEEYTGNLAWSQVRGGDGGFTRVDQSNPNTVYHEYYGISLERSDDGGQNWTTLAGGTGINPNDPVVDDGNDPAAFYVPYILDPANQSRILYGTDHLYESLNRGDLFTAIGTPGTAGFNPNDDVIATVGAVGNTIYVEAGGNIFVTTDDGATWSTAAQPVSGSISDIYVNPANPLDVLAAHGNFGGGHVYHSLDGGGSWTDISGNLPDEPFSAVKADAGSGTIFAGGDDGVYYSADYGGTWTRADMPNVQVVDLAVSPGAGLLAAGTHGRGVYESPLRVIFNPVPVITSARTAGGLPGEPFRYQITATATPTSYGATGLPPGLTVDPVTGLISGTLTQLGTSTITLSASNAVGTGTGTLTLNVQVAMPTITSAGAATGETGQAFSYQIAATNQPMLFEATGLPKGITVSPTLGIISGTPTEAGTFYVMLSATNLTGDGRTTLILTVIVPVPVISSAGTAEGTLGQAFSYQITATGAPTSYEATGLPTGLTLDPGTGLISGTPTQGGTFTVTLSADNDGGAGTATLSLTVTIPVPVISSAKTAGGASGQAFSYQITATNAPTSYGATGLPVGLTVDPGTGLISGTPTQPGSFMVALAAGNAGGTGTGALTLTILPALPTVTIMATTPGVVAGSGDIGEFTLNLSAAQDHDVVVVLMVKGSAKDGTDYETIRTVKRFKAGKTTRHVKIVPLGNGGGAGGKRVVTLVLQPGDGYLVGTTGKVKVRIYGE